MNSIKQLGLVVALALAAGAASATSQPFTATNATVSIDQTILSSTGYTASALGSASYNSTTGVLTDPIASVDLASSPGPLLVTFASGAGIRLAQNIFVGINLTNFSFNLADNTLYGDIAALSLTNQALLTAGTISSSFGGVSGANVTSSGTTRTLGLQASNFSLASDFVAKAGSSASSFQFVANLIKTVNIGTVSITPSVPEPSSYALMGMGLMGVGLLARRRRAAND